MTQCVTSWIQNRNHRCQSLFTQHEAAAEAHNGKDSHASRHMLHARCVAGALDNAHWSMQPKWLVFQWALKTRYTQRSKRRCDKVSEIWTQGNCTYLVLRIVREVVVVAGAGLLLHGRHRDGRHLAPRRRPAGQGRAGRDGRLAQAALPCKQEYRHCKQCLLISTATNFLSQSVDRSRGDHGSFRLNVRV